MKPLSLLIALTSGIVLADDPKPGNAVPPQTPNPENPQPRSHHRRGRELKPFLGVVTAPPHESLRAQLGLSEGEGLLVEAVSPDSPADKAGLKRNDVLKLFNDQILSNPEQLAMLVHRAGKDASITLTVIHQGHEVKLTAVLEEKEMSGPEFRPFPAPPAPGGYPGFRLQGDAHNFLDGYMNQLPQLAGRVGESAKRLQELQSDVQRRIDEVQKRTAEAVKTWETNLGHAPVQATADIKVDVSAEGKAAGNGGGIAIHVEPGKTPTVSASGTLGGTSIALGGATVFYTNESQNGSRVSTLTDGTGTYTITKKAGDTRQVPQWTFTAVDKNGKTLFDGPIDTAEQRATVPDDLTAKLKEIQTRVRSTRDSASKTPAVPPGQPETSSTPPSRKAPSTPAVPDLPPSADKPGTI